VAVVVSGCGMRGIAVPSEIDVRTLDVGPYLVNRFSYPQDADGNGPLLEGERMAAAMVNGNQIDPSLSVGRGGEVEINPATIVHQGGMSEVSIPILQQHQLITAYVMGVADRPDPSGQSHPGPDATSVTIRLLRFPDADTAKLAGRELEEADFDVAQNDNRRLYLTQYPDALIHWRPGVANIGLFMPHNEFVVAIFLQRPAADSDNLLTWAHKTLDAEVPVLDGFHPTPAGDVGSLKVDPDGMLARIAVQSRSDRHPDGGHFAVYGPSYWVQNNTDIAQAGRITTDTTLQSVSGIESQLLFRTAAPQGASVLQDRLLQQLPINAEQISGPPSVPDTSCRHRSDTGVYFCFVRYKRYVAYLNSKDQADVMHRTAAEYALLANSL
jgi:hypothetical protein